ncbi:MAG TPA: peptidoglycan DD-metalloendopeptidase family protein [bacterium]|jgi:murein DD-endopeptidase MepM/ murein hydrolase activator NlpD|nr:peptidoglycan DD-metalloendopeptidase family protein [bacterium]HOG37912.1 peptidoglycan DD-metalloendopeptidase family protein [bacterium]HQI02970.1 peptidoglycan DD-metalloendopeptidase family protein [bacterium]
MNIKIKQNKKILVILLIAFVFFPVIKIKSETIDELNQKITEQKRAIEELNSQQQTYKVKIRQKQQEAKSLNNEISILDNQIAARTLGVQTTKLQIDNMDMEMKAIQLEIEKKEKEIEVNKESLKNSIQELYKKEAKNDALKILLLNDNISDFFDEINQLKSLQSNLQQKVNELNNSKTWLEEKNKTLENSKAELVRLEQQLEGEQLRLKGDQDVKFMYLSRAQNDEKKFQNLLVELRKEQQQANAMISQYETKARTLLASKKGQIQDTGDFIWPVPSKHVTAYFHDPDYPFRTVFEHPAIDIRASQGTPVKASASGYVAIAKDNGMGYNYILLVHNNGISTVYGHISKIYVKTGDFVMQGDTIGLSGGMPGTPGAGRLTTGPHLHFEVRVNGVAVNPLNYLK